MAPLLSVLGIIDDFSMHTDFIWAPYFLVGLTFLDYNYAPPVLGGK